MRNSVNKTFEFIKLKNGFLVWISIFVIINLLIVIFELLLIKNNPLILVFIISRLSIKISE